MTLLKIYSNTQLYELNRKNGYNMYNSLSPGSTMQIKIIGRTSVKGELTYVGK
jgi:hypothetical protein